MNLLDRIVAAMTQRDQPVKAASSPTKADKPAAPASHHINHLTPSKKESIVSSLFVKSYQASPLGSARNIATADALDIAFSDAAVQRSAAQCVQRLAALHEAFGLRSEISAAAVAAMGDGNLDITPERIVAILDRRASEIDDALEALRADKLDHDRAHRDRALRLHPLRAAASQRCSRLIEEFQTLDTRIVAARRCSPDTEAQKRFDALRGQGLTIEQIAALGGLVPNAEVQVEGMKSRMVEVNAEIIKLRAFLADVFSNPAHLDGLDGFQALIEARQGAEIAAPETEAA